MKRILSRIPRNPSLFLGTAIVAALLLVAAAAPVLAPHSPTEPFAGDRLQPPSPAHLLGTDEMGRDML
ncbi:MAG: ABC transporter permease, partial [Bacillota bacterium]